MDITSADVTWDDPRGNLFIHTSDVQAIGKGGMIGLGGSGQDDGGGVISFATIAGRKENSTDHNWAGYLQFTTTAASSVRYERMRINAAGNVGIGTTSPAGILDIYKNTNGAALLYLHNDNTGASALSALNLASDTGTATFRTYSSAFTTAVYRGNSGLFANNDLMLGGGNNAIMRITSAGNVGIGQATPVHKIDVVGTAGLSTGTAWTNTSDIRFKNIQSELTGSSLEKVMALRPVSFTWSELHDTKYGKDPGLKYGFIAQDVQKVIPEFISQDNQGYLWYNPSGMEAILTAAIQEQQKEIEQLRREVAELKRRLDLVLPVRKKEE